MSKIKKGDQVVVLTGKDKGKRGAVLLTVTEKNAVVVEGINRVKKHAKPNPTKGVTGGIVEKEMPINVSNVAIFNAGSGKADRIGFKVLADNRKVRVFKSSGEQIDA